MLLRDSGVAKYIRKMLLDNTENCQYNNLLPQEYSNELIESIQIIKAGLRMNRTLSDIEIAYKNGIIDQKEYVLLKQDQNTII